MAIKTHYPVLLFNDVLCETACGIKWCRPQKRIKPVEVNCDSCRNSIIFRKYALKGDNMANKCTKCGNTESYNFALNIGLCNPCIGERLAELEAEKENLKSLLEQLIFIAEKSTTDDAEDTTIELAAKAINS